MTTEQQPCDQCSIPYCVEDLRPLEGTKYVVCSNCHQEYEDAYNRTDPKQAAAYIKDQLQLIPTVALREESKALKSGADKYGEFNWRHSKGIEAMTYVGGYAPPHHPVHRRRRYRR